MPESSGQIIMKEKFIKGLKWFFFSFIWLAVLLLVIDILTKRLVISAIQNGSSNPICEIIPGFLNIEFTLNKAAAFGLGFENPVTNRVLYICVAVLGSSGITVYYSVKYKSIPNILKASLLMIVSGAIGNLIDRVFYADAEYCVIDWINFYGIWPFHFNIADSCIVVATFIIIIWLIVDSIKEFKQKRALEAKEEGATERVLSIEEQRREQEKKDEESSN